MATFFLLPNSGLTRAPWADPARPAGTLGGSDPGAPSRLNPRAGVSFQRWRCAVGATIELVAVQWGSGWGIGDGGLGGRLYVPQWIEYPNMALASGVRPALVQSAGFSYDVTTTPTVAGHYVLAVTRAREGAALFHFDVEAP